LFILFRVKFPDTLNAGQIGNVKTSLASQKPDDEEMESAEEVKLIKYDAS